MWNIDDQRGNPTMNNKGQSTSTTPAVCRLDDLVQGDERGLQARKLDKQVDCLLIVCLKFEMLENSTFKCWIKRETRVFLSNVELKEKQTYLFQMLIFKREKYFFQMLKDKEKYFLS